MRKYKIFVVNKSKRHFIKHYLVHRIRIVIYIVENIINNNDIE